MVISFFRGGWCGYCNSELEEQQEYYEQIRFQNAELIAIAPQSVETLATLKNEKGLDFDLLSDAEPALRTAKDFNLVWEIPKLIQKIYLEEFDLNVPELNANGTWELPVPATYVVDPKGHIIAKFEDLNYSKRMPVEDIVNILKKNTV